MDFSHFQSTISYSFRTFLQRFLCSRLLRYQETNWVWTQPSQSSKRYMKNNNTTPCKYSMVFLVHHRGLEPRTHWLRVSCSTNWANGAKFGSPSWTRTNDPAVNSRMLYQLSYWGISSGSTIRRCRRWVIFPGRRQPSIVTVNELNYCVRNGNRCTLVTINTYYFVAHSCAASLL